MTETEQAAPHQVYIRWFEDLSADDVAQVGGKNASLGEMLRALKDQGIRVPDGFATTASAYRAFLEANDLEGRIREQLEALKRSVLDLFAQLTMTFAHRNLRVKLAQNMLQLR